MRHWSRRLLAFARPHRAGLGGIFALMLGTLAVDLLKPWPMKLIVDNAFAGRPLPPRASWIAALPGAETPEGLVTWLATATVILFIVAQLLATAQGFAKARIGNRMAYGVGLALFDRLQRLSLRFHTRRSVGDLLRRVTTDSGAIRDLVFNVIFPLVIAIVTIPAMFSVLWQLDRTLALVSLVAAPLLGVMIRVFARPMTELTYTQQVLEGELMAQAEQTLTALPMVQAFGREAREDERFRSIAGRTLRAYLRMTGAQLRFKAGVGAITTLGTATIFLLGGLHVLDGTLTVGALLVFITYLASLYSPMETIAYVSSGYAAAAAGARRAMEILDETDVIEDAPGAVPLELPRRASGDIRIEGVTFGYLPERPVLKGIDLEIPAGEKIAIVGATGAGKSTLASLVPRFIDPQAGRVTLDGIDLRALSVESVRRQVALVLQEPFLLPISVADNISYGRRDATREEIEAAARAANAHDFIATLPRGYDTVIGERGATLSGGQRQRLSIARALLKDAPILILDEPTSALDAATESLLLEALDRLMRGRTTIIIAHRLTTIRDVDRIVVLGDGAIVEQGSPAELLARESAYRAMYLMQYGEAAPASQSSTTDSR
jgi:ATP-binding cassette, subfamily B, bacterial